MTSVQFKLLVVGRFIILSIKVKAKNIPFCIITDGWGFSAFVLVLFTDLHIWKFVAKDTILSKALNTMRHLTFEWQQFIYKN